MVVATLKPCLLSTDVFALKGQQGTRLEVSWLDHVQELSEDDVPSMLEVLRAFVLSSVALHDPCGQFAAFWLRTLQEGWMHNLFGSRDHHQHF